MSTAAAERRRLLTRTAGALALAMTMASAPARSATVDTGITETLGTSDYVGTKLFAKFKDGDYSLRPSYSQFHDDFSSGTYKVLSLRGAYDTERYGVGLEVGGTPQINGYSNTFFGADGILHLKPSTAAKDKDDRRALRLDLGASLTETVHRDEFELGNKRRTNGSVAIGETDLGVSGAAEAFDNYLRLEIVQSVYSSNLGGIAARAPQVVYLSGLDSAISAFPDTVESLRYEFEALPIFVPYAVYTHSTFELGQPAANAYKVGTDAEVYRKVIASVSYERFVQSGIPDQNYYSFGASVKF